MEEEKEQMVEEVEMESMFSPNALLFPLQATPGPVLASFPFWNENMLSSISFCESEWSKYFRICLQYMFIFLYQWYLLTHRRWPRRGELLYPAALFRLLGEIFSYNRVFKIYLNFGLTFDIQVSIGLCFISPTQRTFHTLLKTTPISDVACCAPDNMKGDNYSARYHSNIS